jgi:two-component system, sensor histidine kinase and response regulator
VLASGVALFAVSRQRMRRIPTLVGAVLMGSGVAGMHYVGMDAMRLPAMCRYSPGIVGLSVILAIVISLVALWLTFHCRDEARVTAPRKLASALLMGAAIPVMHYTGMAAVTFLPAAQPQNLTHAVAISSLSTFVVSSVALVILGLTILTSQIDRRFAAQAVELQRLLEALRLQNEHLEETVAARTGELAEANSRLTILDRAKDDFLRIISHELRTPLNGLLGVGEIVLGDPSLADDSELRAMFEQSRQKMISLLDDALLLTQIDVSGQKFSSAPISLNLVLDRALERAMPFAGPRNVTLQPAPAGLGQVRGEADLLVRCFHALLETAVKFSEKGGAVRLASEAEPDRLRVVIQCHGRTIPDSIITKFFDIFSICEAVSPGEDLGLSAPVASRILALFGSTVTVANCEPPGIRLTVDFENRMPASSGIRNASAPPRSAR